MLEVREHILAERIHNTKTNLTYTWIRAILDDVEDNTLAICYLSWRQTF